MIQIDIRGQSTPTRRTVCQVLEALLVAAVTTCLNFGVPFAFGCQWPPPPPPSARAGGAHLSAALETENVIFEMLRWLKRSNEGRNQKRTRRDAETAKRAKRRKRETAEADGTAVPRCARGLESRGPVRRGLPRGPVLGPLDAAAAAAGAGHPGHETKASNHVKLCTHIYIYIYIYIHIYVYM